MPYSEFYETEPLRGSCPWRDVENKVRRGTITLHTSQTLLHRFVGLKVERARPCLQKHAVSPCLNIRRTLNLAAKWRHHLDGAVCSLEKVLNQNLFDKHVNMYCFRWNMDIDHILLIAGSVRFCSVEAQGNKARRHTRGLPRGGRQLPEKFVWLVIQRDWF